MPRIFLIRSNLKLVTEIQNNIKAQQSRAYARKVSLTNLQQAARTVAFIQENGIESRDELKRRLDGVNSEYAAITKQLREIREQLLKTNETIHHLGQYLSLKKIYAEFLNSSDKGTFCDAHRNEINKYNESHTFLCEHYSQGCLPQMKEVKSIKASLVHDYNQLKLLRIRINKSKQTLLIASRNLDKLLAEDISIHHCCASK